MDWSALLFTAVLIGVASNLDNLGVGMAYGMLGVHFPHRVNLLVNAIGLCTVLAGALGGTLVARYLPAGTSSKVSCAVLMAVGVGYWYAGYLRPRLRRDHRAGRPDPPGWRAGIALGFGLSFTNVANGFGATVSQRALLAPVVVTVTAFGYLNIWLGNLIGIEVLARWLHRYGPLLAGLLMILVALHQLVA